MCDYTLRAVRCGGPVRRSGAAARCGGPVRRPGALKELVGFSCASNRPGAFHAGNNVNIKHIAMIRQPRSRLWPLMRDNLPELAAHLEDIESVITTAREMAESGGLTVTSVWRARAGLASLMNDSAKGIAWTDRSRWLDDFKTCWEVTPHVMGGRLRCAGVTSYVEAMGGRGTRAVLELSAELLPDPLTGKSQDSDKVLFQTVQSIAATLICKNFRRLLELADQRLRAGAALVKG